jgi:hypothetical protein
MKKAVATQRYADKGPAQFRRDGNRVTGTNWKRSVFGHARTGRGLHAFDKRAYRLETRWGRAPVMPGREGELPGGLGELRKRFRVPMNLKVPQDPIMRGSWNPDLDVPEPPPSPKKESKAARSWNWKVVALLLVGLLVATSAIWALPDQGLGPGSPVDRTGPRWKDESAKHFTFAASADFGHVSDINSLAVALRARAAGMSFLLAIGDLGHATDEASWCHQMKRHVPELVIGTGYQEPEENEDGNTTEYLKSCPFPLESWLVPGNGTPGYGHEYYFDYPAKNPLARFIIISPGLRGALDYDYGEDSPHTEWMEDAVDDARDEGIPWVIAASHEQCITVGKKARCSMGQAIFDELVDAKVDLVLMGHDRVYQRSHQLAESDECESVNSTNQFEEGCIVADGSMGMYPKGEGTVVVGQGVGGEELHNVTLDGSDREIGYFVEAMGANANTQGVLPGFGSVFYRVTAESISAITDFCPRGSVAPDGRCTAASSAVFRDRFSILDLDPGADPLPVGDAVSGERPSNTSVVDPLVSPAGGSTYVRPLPLYRRPPSY